jgi:hypothetical protein
LHFQQVKLDAMACASVILVHMGDVNRKIMVQPPLTLPLTPYKTPDPIEKHLKNGGQGGVEMVGAI